MISNSHFVGTIVGTSVLVFRASTWNDLGWTTAYILPAAVLAFMLGVSEYLLVYHTSGLTLSVSGVFKVLLLAILFQECSFYTSVYEGEVVYT